MCVRKLNFWNYLFFFTKLYMYFPSTLLYGICMPGATQAPHEHLNPLHLNVHILASHFGQLCLPSTLLIHANGSEKKYDSHESVTWWTSSSINWSMLNKCVLHRLQKKWFASLGACTTTFAELLLLLIFTFLLLIYSSHNFNVSIQSFLPLWSVAYEWQMC